MRISCLWAVALGVLGHGAANAQTVAAVEEQTNRQDDGFAFGSYGRVMVGSDFEGSTPDPVHVVAHGARIVEPTYLELDLYYRLQTGDGIQLTTVTTMAFGDELFHSTGEFDAKLALRNFYLLAEKDNYGVWAGSRMYRGNDIYLLDYWPLDDLNTVGGGAFYSKGKFATAVHVGLHRLQDPFQFQQRQVLRPGGFGAQEIEQLDRVRYVGSAQATYQALDLKRFKLRTKLYTEYQAMAAGERRMEDGTPEQLPADSGFTVGAQLGLWGYGDRSTHTNLFARYSKGLAAYDELAVPVGLAPDRTVTDAKEIVIGASGTYEHGRFGLMYGGYARLFVDADGNERDRDDGWEYVADVRPRARVFGPLEAAVDVSYQARFPRAASPNTLTAMDPAVFQVAPMFLYSPFGPDSYARPQFRLVYRAAHLNEGARDLYPMEDLRRNEAWVHYLGVQAEWWFKSSRNNRSLKVAQ